MSALQQIADIRDHHKTGQIATAKFHEQKFSLRTTLTDTVRDIALHGATAQEID